MKVEITNNEGISLQGRSIRKTGSKVFAEGLNDRHALDSAGKARLIPVYLFVLFMVIALLAGTAAQAQDKSAEIDKIFSWATPSAPGCVCAVSKNGELIYNKAFGSADLERTVPLSTSSVLDAGSVVKQFVAASVLLLVEDGKLSLTEDIHRYIPELPDYGHKITLNHLLTHTSGIRDWQGIRGLAEGDPEVLPLILRQRSLNFKPGDEWSYSNSGYELLKEIVARSSGMSFSDFTQKRLFEPLKMKSSKYITDMNEVIKDRALAYAKEKDGWKLDMYFGNDRGGGALLSTPGDLLIWNEALANNRLGNFVTEKMHERTALNNGRKLRYARGLNIDTRGGDKLVWHTGGAAGYSTMLVRLPEHALSVAIMCNLDGGARDAYASRIFDLFLPPAKNEAEENKTQPELAVDVNGKAGIFYNEQTGQALRLVVNNSRLGIAGAGPLITVAEDRFRNQRSTPFLLSEADFELRFLSADKFEIKTKEGEIMHYRRAKAYATTAAELNAFAGLYESKEMGSVMEVLPEKDGLVIRFLRNPAKALHLKPVEKDIFIQGMLTVRFQRDKGGKIIGFHYSNPLVRNIKFTRLADSAGN